MQNGSFRIFRNKLSFKEKNAVYKNNIVARDKKQTWKYKIVCFSVFIYSILKQPWSYSWFLNTEGKDLVTSLLITE